MGRVNYKNLAVKVNKKCQMVNIVGLLGRVIETVDDTVHYYQSVAIIFKYNE